MLLSFPTWVVHISSMVEWLVASILLYRYGKLIGRKDIEQFALLMLPHWVGGMCVIIYHLTTDSVEFWLDASKVINLIGSVALLYASLRIIRQPARPAIALASLIGIFASYNLQDWSELIPKVSVQLSSLVYFSFLVSLLFLYRKDKTVFSGLTVFGFWFVLVFVAVTIVCTHFAVNVRGYPTLTHDDLLHGFAESLLTLSNLMIAIGIAQKLKATQESLASQPERATAPQLSK
jgi:glucan phosphoethanolaminetransferase (alkaline phosphatase superfamily)